MKDSRLFAMIGTAIFAGAFLPVVAAIMGSVVFFGLAVYNSQTEETQEEKHHGTSKES